MLEKKNHNIKSQNSGIKGAEIIYLDPITYNCILKSNKISHPHNMSMILPQTICHILTSTAKYHFRNGLKTTKHTKNAFQTQ